MSGVNTDLNIGGPKAVERAIESIANTIEREGDASLAGIEQEVITLRQDGRPMHHAHEYQDFLSALIHTTDPDARIERAQGLTGQALVMGAKTADGTFCPETSTITTEFATNPMSDSWGISSAIHNLSSAFAQVCAQGPYAALATALPPGIAFADVAASGAPIPNPSFAYSYGNIMSGQRDEVSATSFANASIHNNQGFADPEAMVRFMRTCLYMQPTMIAMTANSPLWDNARAVDDEGRALLSRRTWLQTKYERFLGYSDLEYLYPSFLLDWKRGFEATIRGYMDQPLDRTIVGGEKTYVGGLTMARYLAEGFNTAAGKHFPDQNALNMMFSEPMVDVRLRPYRGARVEARTHEGSAPELAPAINAFYRGIAANLAEAEDLMRQYCDMRSVREQRVAVCYTGLHTPVNVKDDAIRTQADLAIRLLDIAHRGLEMRGLGEQALLTPLQSIALSGITPAERQLQVFQDCGENLRTPRNREHFMQSFAFRPARMQAAVPPRIDYGAQRYIMTA